MGEYVLRINVLKLLNKDIEKCNKNFQWTIRSLFSQQKSILESLTLFSSLCWIFSPYEFVRRFLQRLSFQKNSKRSTENVFEDWEITKTHNWIRLLIFDGVDTKPPQTKCPITKHPKIKKNQYFKMSNITKCPIFQNVQYNKMSNIIKCPI